MPLNITIKSHDVIGNKRQTIAVVAFGSSYPVGGESLTARNLGLSVIDVLTADPKSGYLFEYDYVNSKLKVFHPRAAIANTLSVTTPVLAHASGDTAVTSTAATMPSHAATACTISGVAGVAAGAGAEVPDGTNLSALTDVRVVAIGV